MTIASAPNFTRAGCLLVVAVGVLTACSGDGFPPGLIVTGPPRPDSVTVQMTATTFAPADVTVGRGGTVTWTNATATAHTITPVNVTQPGVWQGHNVPADAGYTFAHTFTVTGVFNYFCAIHAGMTGVVRVQ